MFPNPLERKHSTFRQVIDKFFGNDHHGNKKGVSYKASASAFKSVSLLERRKLAPGGK